MKKILTASVAGALAITSAHATTVDFSGLPLLTDVTTQYAAQGVTFSGLDDFGNAVNIESYGNTGGFDDVGAPFVLSDYYNGDPGSRALDMIFTFTSPASGVSFDYNPAGDLGSSTVFEAFSPGGTLLASFSDPNATTDDGSFYNESFGSLSDIGSVEIVAPQDGWGHYVGDLEFTENGSAVPDGGLTVALLGSAFGAMTVLRRKMS